MSGDWQKILKDHGVATLDQLAERYGRDVIDVEALKPAFDKFQMRLSPQVLETITGVDSPVC